MNTTFNINRLGLLLKRYFIENKQRQLSAWGIIIFVFIILHRTASAEMFLYIYGFIFAANMFKVFNYTPGGMHYLLIPATQTEKLTASILISTFYCFIMVVVCNVIGVTTGTILSNLIFSSNYPIQFELFNYTSDHMIFIHHQSIWGIFVTFASIQSVFLLGSIYFKGNAVGKTILSIIAIFIVLVILEVLFLKITFGTTHLNLQMQNFSIYSKAGFMWGTELAGSIVKYSLIPFFWVVTYFRLTEKEI